MTEARINTADLARLDSLDLDQLYAELAISDAGAEPEIGDALDSVAELRTMMSADAVASSIGGLIRRGRRIFNRHWPRVKEIVCKFYEEHGEDWIAKAAEAVAKALGLPGAVAAYIIKIAIKLGMDAICDADATPQPA